MMPAPHMFAPLHVTVGRIRIVLESLLAEGLDPRFERDVQAMLRRGVTPRKLWKSLAELVTWAHVPPGIYADGRNTGTREKWLNALEVLLAALLVGMEPRR